MEQDSHTGNFYRYTTEDSRSDSGISSLRSNASSGDERSGSSRCSAISSSEEVSLLPPLTKSPSSNVVSEKFLHSSQQFCSSSSGLESVPVWRDPNLWFNAVPSIRHIDSVQHRSLLMSHSGAVVPAGSSSAPSNTSATQLVTVTGAVSSNANSNPVLTVSSPAHFQTTVPMLTPHPLHQLPHPPPTAIYSQVPEMLWKQQRYGSMPPIAPSHHLHPAAEELLDRERGYVHDRERQDRLLREREHQEVEKHKERDREKQQERDRVEKERLEKQRAEQAVHRHFEESLRLAQQKRNCWNLITSLPPPGTVSSSAIRNEEDRKRIAEQEQRLIRSESRDREKVASVVTFPPYALSIQKPGSSSGKVDYNQAATLSHNRIITSKSQISLPKSDANFNAYGYPAYQAPLNFLPQDKLVKLDHFKKNTPGLVVNSIPISCTERDRDNSSLDMKSSVIVKNDGKSVQHSDPQRSGIPSHSVSPKLRETHYLQSPSNIKYDYRSPTQSPLQMAHSNSASPHQMHADNKVHHRQPTHHSQSPLPSHRQSPHHRQSPLPSQASQQQMHRSSPHSSIRSNPSPPDQRFGPVAGGIPMYPKHGTVGPTYYNSSVPSGHVIPMSSSLVKSKVSSPAPPHIYGKPTSGITSGTPVCRAVEISLSPVPLTSKQAVITPSPYQQLSHHQLPPSNSPSPSNLTPPPAHSSRSSSMLGDPRTFSVPYTANVSIKPVPPSSELVAPVSSFQSQPLDLGTRDSPNDSSKRKRIDDISIDDYSKKFCLSNRSPIRDRVTEPSPSIANASETMMAVVNMAIESSFARSPEDHQSTVIPISATPTPPIPCDSPISTNSTPPAKFNTDSEKSCSPKPPSYSGHKLKKAWLQRHSGEDGSEDKSSLPNASNFRSTLLPPLIDIDNTSVTNGTNVESGISIDNVGGGNSDNSSSDVNKCAKTIDDGNDNCTIIEDESSCDTIHCSEDSKISALSPPATPIKDNSGENNSIASPPVLLQSIGSMAVNSINKIRPKASKKPARDNRSSPLIVNGHLSPKINSDESSSSDVDTKVSPKRLPPKIKRKKYSVPRKPDTEEQRRKKLPSSSSTDSDKESGSEKDSDTSGTGKKSCGSVKDEKNSAKETSRKRGRKPKGSNSGTTFAGSKNDSSSGGNSNGESSKEKKPRDDSSWKDPFPKPPISQLKKTGESFLQDGPCFEVAPKLAKCRECRWTPNQRSRNNIFCRFYAFRRLRYTKNGQLAIAGFSDPHADASSDDLSLWLPNIKTPPVDLDIEMARFLLCRIGDQFCDLLMQESEALSVHISEDKKIAWKRVVQGVREMCDVCETTLFNFHWACGKCGFVVCIDCYKGRKNGCLKIWGEPGKDRDDLSWLLCTNRQPHEQEKLMLTQIIAGDCVSKLATMSHESRAMWEVPIQCGCPLADKVPSSNGTCKDILKDMQKQKQQQQQVQQNNQIKKEPGDHLNDNNKENTENHDNIKESLCNEVRNIDIDPDSRLKWLADVALSNEANSSDTDDVEVKESYKIENSFGNKNVHKRINLRALFLGQSESLSSPESSTDSNDSSQMPFGNGRQKQHTDLELIDEIMSTVMQNKKFPTDEFSMGCGSYLNGGGNFKHYVPRYCRPIKWRDPIPTRIMTLTESKLLYPGVSHTWLCDGKLLRLLEPEHPGNYAIFQDQWKRGQPVLVSDVTKKLDNDLWHPDSFAKDFGDIKNDLINCMTGNLVLNQPMRKFWEGFECSSRRLKDEKGNPMLLKLKDWPPGEDFAEMLPTRFNDLMNALPLGEYTHRNGRLNLASRLPECFVRPDLGPKMYNAYGSALHPGKGTTNLHLDISDAVNVMMYVGIPKDGESEEFIKGAYRAIDEAGCDILTRRRVREKGEIPGALWHIYHARDADKIRDLLNKVAIENGLRLEPHHDPIHDQSWYLDGVLRERLYKEYSVEGYAIVQCLGDAVFIPAGAPHQVRNLHNCIKVAEDFVSPENVSHCFHLTQEFRDLSDTHSNHEDKLQIKNIMYHAVKDSLSVLGATYANAVSSETPVNQDPVVKEEPQDNVL